MGSIGNNQLEVAFKQIVDRHPVVARGFHSQMGSLAAFKPLDHFHQLRCCRPKTFGLTHHRSTQGSFQYADHYSALMYIEASTAGMFNFHGLFSDSPCGGSGLCQDTLTFAFPNRSYPPVILALCGP